MPPPKPEHAAGLLLRRFGIKDAPIPVDELAARLGAQVVHEPLQGDISGMLFRDDDRIVIGVNSAEARVRQRFTVAHELGHLRLHPGKRMIVDKLVRVDFREGGRRSPSNRQEREANQFAAALLMPGTLVRKKAESLLSESQSPSEDRLVEGLAGSFEVSEQAMLYRLVNLGLLSPFALEGG